MTETTQEERDQIRAEVCKPIPNLSLMRLTAKAVCNDADRLAKLEDGIRELVSEYEATPCNLSPSCVVEELRALMGDD